MEESPASGAAAAKQVFEKMGEGQFAVIVIKGESPSNEMLEEPASSYEHTVFSYDETFG